jgi:hypothetical protein
MIDHIHYERAAPSPPLQRVKARGEGAGEKYSAANLSFAFRLTIFEENAKINKNAL